MPQGTNSKLSVPQIARLKCSRREGNITVFAVFGCNDTTDIASRPLPAGSREIEDAHRREDRREEPTGTDENEKVHYPGNQLESARPA